MKENIYIEFRAEQISQKQLVNIVKGKWLEQGNKVKDIKTLDLYYKPDEKACYYVINGCYNGNFNL